MKKSKITPKNEDFAKWYTDIVLNANLFAYGPVKGTMILEPRGYQLWENIQKYLNAEFSKLNVENVYFPLLIPERLFEKEKEHIVGFSPEVLKVTEIGNKKINEPLVIRPTSEVLFCNYFSKKINSINDLPIKLNQWVNIMRWENNTRPFLRNSEFLWQEGHTCHADKTEALLLVDKMLHVYEKMCEKKLALATFSGVKSESEKFAGALKTLAVETMMPDGQALQIGTSHFLGNNFAKAFKIRYNDNNVLKYVYQTSWGVSTRLIGGLIMAHSDDFGIVLPPDISPYQVMLSNLNLKSVEIKQLIKKIKNENENISFYVDNTPKKFGFKIISFEHSGTPLGVFIGDREMADGKALVIDRSTNKKEFVVFNKLQEYLKLKLAEIQKFMLFKQHKFLNEMKQNIEKIDEMKIILQKQKAAIFPFCGETECENKIKNTFGVVSRVLLNNPIKNCLNCKKKTVFKGIFSRAY